MAKSKELACVKYEIDDEGIAWVMFNRPEKRNAMNPELHYDMEEVIAELETDDDAKIIVLTGSGESWSSGMDLREFFRATDNDPAARFKAQWAHRHWAQYVATSQKATIAMVNGFCFGGAFCSLAACDIVVTADDATFGLSEINWGILPGGNVSKVFADLANHRNAMFYAMTGRTFDGIKAVEMGIATLSVPKDRLKDEVTTIARELMEKSPVVLAYTKQAMSNVGDMDMNMAYEYLATKGLALRAIDPGGTRERGMTEFLDKKTYRPGLGPVSLEDE
ncbi:MAG: p-hydroxycinnamoyl CoA hydratase/lyase [Rhodospirillales bacterium]|jgi:trans-feruloyl-CoA hydratase/vanillin synthase|nr:p-hydroxycinnamoyl CoA hydratase/lyase [Rhodospirillaceae bacterium]MDP6426955.1 p-hydroxycinnamoyl CoA hydratase/lyase [Rhodospirillales bacterium]MDP6645343.1 p-hydroxycinnamoyl CoA hydratase/lyase [Rhodospirillales bacterium]MDP6841759.1 p-hydroxycinnamoyl CoA hydratase/lyase [Rhodospirillales bacterium]|tara:strand:+ start:2600 stop:3433 length:834 start_codon:yes stop_codon:yes gene_type:complete